ncbi:MAG: FeoA family protein [Verrucomicrobiota bacterium]|nr:FeoA family protein [Verrucomicrobiota bacterium]
MRERHRKKCHSEICRKSETDSWGTKCSLADALEDDRVRICRNQNHKTMEFGLYPGASARIIQNNGKNHSILIQIHGQRYGISYNIAKNIMVKICCAK